MPINIVNNIQNVLARIRAAEAKYHRQPQSVVLLPVSKTHSVESCRLALQAGVNAFGENYLQDALPKIKALADEKVVWHFIGAIQSNKVADIAEHFDWVQSVSRSKIAQLLSEKRSASQSELNICIQLNISQNPNKSGCQIGEMLPLAKFISKLPKLKLRGLMVIPEKCNNFNQECMVFQKTWAIYNSLQAQGFDLDTLSMGMSADLEAAVACGSTMVRVGTDIFGPRALKPGASR